MTTTTAELAAQLNVTPAAIALRAQRRGITPRVTLVNGGDCDDCDAQDRDGTLTHRMGAQPMSRPEQ